MDHQSRNRTFLIAAPRDMNRHGFGSNLLSWWISANFRFSLKAACPLAHHFCRRWSGGQADKRMQILKRHRNQATGSETSPAICIGARPFESMLDDLELATEAKRSIEMSSDYFYEQDREADWIKTFRDLIDNETNYRRSLGDDGYDA